MAIDVGPAPAGPLGIPTKYLVIGGGAALVGIFLMMQSRGSAPAAGGDGSAQTLTPNAAVALGSLQSDFRQQIGDLQKMLGSGFGDLSTHLDSSAAALGDQFGTFSQEWQRQYGTLSTGQKQIFDQVFQAYSQLAQGQNQLWNRLGDPTWLPGGSGDPWGGASQGDERQTATKLGA